MRIKKKLAVVAIAVAALIGGIAATAATATSARAATAACGWENIYSASSSSGGTVQLQYDTCDRNVRAHAYNLPDDYGCTGVNFGCHGIVSEVRVYNEDTKKEAGSGVIDQSSFTTGAIDDAGTQSHACFMNGNDDNGTISWGPSACTAYY